MLLEMLAQLWKEVAFSKHFAFLRPNAKSIMHVLVAQEIPGITLDEAHAIKCACVLNAAMALHKHNSQAAVLFKTKHRIGHPDNLAFSLSNRFSSGLKYPKNKFFNFENRRTARKSAATRAPSPRMRHPEKLLARASRNIGSFISPRKVVVLIFKETIHRINVSKKHLIKV